MKNGTLWRECIKCTRNTLQGNNLISYTKEDFGKAYILVITRCFGWNLASTMLIPYADNFNHSSCDVGYEVVNTDLHIIYNESKKSYYTKDKFKIDYSIIKCHPKETQCVNKKIIVDISIYKLENDLGKEGVKKFLKEDGNNVWNM